MSSTPYDREFFDFLDAGSLASARVVLPELFNFFRPQSVVDIGCGEGAWLRAAQENGVVDLLGMDGTYVDCDKLLVQKNQFHSCDLKDRIQLSRRFDLAISLEVAEHLPYDRSQTFVADLCQLSDVVLFSAAMPFQGGTDHINEQWLEFWGILFRKHNYVAYDFLREKIWKHKEVESWYQQNLLVFVNSARTSIKLPVEFLAERKCLSSIHPIIFLVNASRWRPLLPEALDLEFQDYRALLHAYTEGERELPPLKILSAHAQRDGVEIDLFPLVRTIITDPAEELRTCISDNWKRQSDEAKKHNEIIEQLRSYLEARNGELERRAELLRESNRINEELRKYLEARNEELERRAELLRESNEIIEELRKYLETRNEELGRLSEQLRDTQAVLIGVQNDCGRLSRELGLCATKIVEQGMEIATIREERDRTQEAVDSLVGSLSWKITTPLRYFSKRVRELRGLSGS
jgi:hypothetical protein